MPPAPYRINMPRQSAGLHCYFRVNASLESMASPLRSPAAWSALPAALSAPFSHGSFAAIPAGHGIAERTAEIERPDAVRHHFGRNGSEPDVLPQHGLHAVRRHHACGPGIGGVGQLTSAGITSPVTGTVPVIWLI